MSSEDFRLSVHKKYTYDYNENSLCCSTEFHPQTFLGSPAPLGNEHLLPTIPTGKESHQQGATRF